MGTLIWFAVGALVGWNFPQPAFAKKIQEWLVNKWKDLFSN